MSESIKLIIAGDLFPTAINRQLFSDGNEKVIFGNEVCEMFRAADYSICNLEGCFTEESTLPKLKDGPNIRASKECINAIKGLGVDCVSLANNHATDFGIKGLEDTYAVLDKVGIFYFGAGKDEASVTTSHTVVLNEKRITFYGVAETVENVPGINTPGVNIYDEYRVCQEIRSLKEESDYLIVLYHGGIENIHYNTPSIRNRFHRMADNGADIIISQHTHAIGEEEFYKNSYLLYGQGNFCFHFSKKLYEWVETALLLEVDLEEKDFVVKKHIIRRDGAGIIYDKKQDFSDFYERSKRLKEGDKFIEELKELADEKILIYLQAFRGKNIIDRIVKKLFSEKKYLTYLKKQYTKKNILKILLALQCEEFREVSSAGLYNMLDELEDKHEK